MARKALGLIETLGLVAAVGATDAALKAADVTLIGFDFPGNGGTTVKIEGDVAAVKFAVEVGTAAAEKIYKVLAHHVISMPYEELDVLIQPKEKKSPVKKASPKKSDKAN